MDENTTEGMGENVEGLYRLSLSLRLGSTSQFTIREKSRQIKGLIAKQLKRRSHCRLWGECLHIANGDKQVGVWPSPNRESEM